MAKGFGKVLLLWYLLRYSCCCRRCSLHIQEKVIGQKNKKAAFIQKKTAKNWRHTMLSPHQTKAPENLNFF